MSTICIVLNANKPIELNKIKQTSALCQQNKNNVTDNSTVTCNKTKNMKTQTLCPIIRSISNNILTEKVVMHKCAV